MNALFQRAIAGLLMIFFLTANLGAQAGPTPPTSTDAPRLYGPAEFPQWQLDLRRGEIIAFGSLPFVTFLGSIGYDVYRYYSHDQAEGYLPWPLKKKDSAIPLSEDEQKNIFLAAAGISLGITLTDFIVRLVKRKSSVRQRQRESAGTITIERIN